MTKDEGRIQNENRAKVAQPAKPNGAVLRRTAPFSSLFQSLQGVNFLGRGIEQSLTASSLDDRRGRHQAFCISANWRKI